MEQTYLARHNKSWQKIATGEILGDKLTLKPGEKLTDYRQMPKPAEPPRPQRGKKQGYEFMADKNNDEKGVF